jgi:uncharacterized repeat protein (TIGR03803 family)
MLYALGSKFAARSVCGILCLAVALPVTFKSTNAASVESVAYRFPNFGAGYIPTGRLVQDAAGTLYGTTFVGGTASKGTVFKFVPPAGSQKTGQLTVLHQFAGADGANPQGSLALGAKGVLYGTTSAGGDGLGDGTLFELLPPAAGQTNWSEVVIHAFDHGVDGNSPAPGLLIGKNGTLYGVLAGAGSAGYGAIFALAPPKSGTAGAWTETVLYKFKGGTDGFAPSAPPISDASGALYGTTADSGPTVPFGARDGTVYKLTPPAAGKTAWTKTTLYSFKGGADGSIPAGPLVRDRGTLYGTTKGGNGTVFKLTPPAAGKTAWVLTTLHSFTGTPDGKMPSPAGLVIDSQGALIGTTLYGGTANDRGTVFKLTPPKTGAGRWTETVLHAFAGGNDGTNPGSAILSATGLLVGNTAFGGGNGCAGPGNPNPAGCGTIFKLTE